MSESYLVQFEKFKKLKEEVQDKKTEYEVGMSILRRSDLTDDEDCSVRGELVELSNEIDELRVQLDEMILLLRSELKFSA